MRNTTKLLLTTLATATIALALLQGTGAVQLTQGDDIGQSIVLEPHPGPNGQYAYYDADGELAVDLSASNPNVEGDGPNDDAVTAVPEVFTVTNEGDSTARVWIETTHPLVTFTARGDAIEGTESAVHLAPNESVAVGLRVVTTDDVLPDVVADSFTVHAVVADGADDDDARGTTVGRVGTVEADDVDDGVPGTTDDGPMGTTTVDGGGAPTTTAIDGPTTGPGGPTTRAPTTPRPTTDGGGPGTAAVEDREDDPAAPPRTAAPGTSPDSGPGLAILGVVAAACLLVGAVIARRLTRG